MNAKDVLRHALNTNHFITKMLLSDLSDADLLTRPVPGANHLAWQLGHLINAEASFLKSIPGAVPPALPAGFAEAHKKETAGSDTGFLTKEQYLNLFDQVRQASLKALDDLPEADLDKPSTVIPQIAPTVGTLFLLMASHQMMHGGQFTVARRKLGKPVLF